MLIVVSRIDLGVDLGGWGQQLLYQWVVDFFVGVYGVELFGQVFGQVDVDDVVVVGQCVVYCGCGWKNVQVFVVEGGEQCVVFEFVGYLYVQVLFGQLLVQVWVQCGVGGGQ